MSTKLVLNFMACLVLATALAPCLIAQQTSSSPDAPAQPPQDAGNKPASGQPASQPQDKQGSSKDAGKDSNKGKIAGTSNDRLFFALPNFLSLQNAGSLPPLTAKQKFGVVAQSAFDPIAVPWYGTIAAVSQARNSEPGFGQGWGGYGKRVAAAFSDGCIENFMVGAVLPSVLHQDPRFLEKGQGGFFHRSLYAASRIVVTRSDGGHAQFNFSEVFGSAASAVISTYSYHPKSRYVSTPTNPHLFIPSDRTVRNTAAVWGTQIGYDTFTLFLKEFWPDIHRRVSPKYRRGSTETLQTSLTK